MIFFPRRCKDTQKCISQTSYIYDNYIVGRSQTTLTKVCPLLTTYLSPVDIFVQMFPKGDFIEEYTKLKSCVPKFSHAEAKCEQKVPGTEYISDPSNVKTFIM
jgi:hypothetical protein